MVKVTLRVSAAIGAHPSLSIHPFLSPVLLRLQCRVWWHESRYGAGVGLAALSSEVPPSVGNTGEWGQQERERWSDPIYKCIPPLPVCTMQISQQRRWICILIRHGTSLKNAGSGWAPCRHRVCLLFYWSPTHLHFSKLGHACQDLVLVCGFASA